MAARVELNGSSHVRQRAATLAVVAAARRAVPRAAWTAIALLGVV
jgi:hypothetical protein